MTDPPVHPALPLSPSQALDFELNLVHRGLEQEWETQDALLTYLLTLEQAATAHSLYASVILAVGLPEHDTPRTLAQRCQLAIALELLGTALQVHRLVLVEDGSPDSYLSGTAVLMGDHHFARSAQLVTQLGNPPLLDAFANVLKVASEQYVASLMVRTPEPFNVASVISSMGILCGAHLWEHQGLDLDAILKAWQDLALSVRNAPVSGPSALAPLLAAVPQHQEVRWQACGIQYLTLLAQAPSSLD